VVLKGLGEEKAGYAFGVGVLVCLEGVLGSFLTAAFAGLILSWESFLFACVLVHEDTI